METFSLCYLLGVFHPWNLNSKHIFSLCCSNDVQYVYSHAPWRNSKGLWPRIIYYYFRYNNLFHVWPETNVFVHATNWRKKFKTFQGIMAKTDDGNPQILLWVLPLLWVRCFVQPGKTLRWPFSSLCVLMHWTDEWTRGKPSPTHKPKRRLQTAHRPSETPARRQTTLGMWKNMLKIICYLW